MERIGEKLCEEGAAVEKKGGVFGPKRLFIPEKAYKEALIEELRTAVREDELTPRDAALMYLLEEAKCLKQYFSKYESDRMKEKLKAGADDRLCKQHNGCCNGSSGDDNELMKY